MNKLKFKKPFRPLLLFLWLFLLAQKASAVPPNIIFIMVDDMGYADLGMTGSRHINTPNIDQLAEGGIFMKNGYANSAICSPTRTALFTGNYQYRYEIGLKEPIGKTTGEAELPRDIPNLATTFSERGYETTLIGKWHLGDIPDEGPLAYGYDHFFGIAKGASDYFFHGVTPGKKVEGQGLFVDDEAITREGYLTSLFTEEAVNAIDRASGDQPFFISLHYNAPHWPWEGPEDKAIAKSLTGIFHWDGGNLETYKIMMEEVDKGVARITQALKHKGISDNTIIVFTSDNGAERFSDAWPYVGYKGELLEGGIRVPIIVQWPEQISAGTISDQVMLSMDFLPTLAAATERPVDENEFDGVNLLQVLKGHREPLERTVYWRFNASDQAAIRQGNWKYLRLGNKEHLFNLSEDSRERARLQDRYPEKFSELKQAWHKWNATMLPYREGDLSEKLETNYPDRY